MVCFAQNFLGVFQDQNQMNGLKTESEDEIWEGWVETGDRGRTVVG